MYLLVYELGRTYLGKVGFTTESLFDILQLCTATRKYQSTEQLTIVSFWYLKLHVANNLFYSSLNGIDKGIALYGSTFVDGVA